MVRRAILFSFYKEPDLCKYHLDIFHSLNPNIPIYGLYCGEKEKIDLFKNLPLNHLWISKINDPMWKWKNGDLVDIQWFKDVGHTFDFDVLHRIDWDVVLLKPLDELFNTSDGIYLSGLISISKIYNTWNWVLDKRRDEFLQLLEDVKRKFNYNQEPFGCIGCGPAFSREFIDKYSRINPIENCCTEIRWPLYAQCLGINIYDTGFSNSHFRTTAKIIEQKEAYEAMTRGIFAFHPVRKMIKWK